MESSQDKSKALLVTIAVSQLARLPIGLDSGTSTVPPPLDGNSEMYRSSGVAPFSLVVQVYKFVISQNLFEYERLIGDVIAVLLPNGTLFLKFAIRMDVNRG